MMGLTVQMNLALPTDAVVPGVMYTPQDLPPVSNTFIPVRISQIESPGNFWLQLDEVHAKLEALMLALQLVNRFAPL